MIDTERLSLRLLEETDEQDIIRWRNDKEIIDCFFSYKGITSKEHREWFEKYVKGSDRIEFIICIKSNNKKIGTIGLSNIDHRNQKAEYGILLGEKDERGKGFGKEATLALLDYGFYELNLNKIFLKVFSDNTNAIELYKKAGFKEDGLLRKDVFKNGQFKDVLIMSILRDERKK